MATGRIRDDREQFSPPRGARRNPAALTGTGSLGGATGAVLDPIVSLRIRLRVPPGVTARVSFTTIVGENEDQVRGLIEKYHDPQVCARAFALASTHSEIGLRHLGVSRDDEILFQRLVGYITFADPRLRSAEHALRSTGVPQDLWKHGISGDLPIVLVTVADSAEVAVAQELVRAQEYLRSKGLKFDLVVLKRASQAPDDVQEELQRLADRAVKRRIDRPVSVSPAIRFCVRQHADAGNARAIFEASEGKRRQLRRPLGP